MQIANNSGFIKRNLPVITAFVLPVLILSVIFICNEVFPFGDEMYLRSDMYHQYAPFMRAFQRILQEGGSLSFTWDIGLGSNFASTYSYYLASPVNWIIALFPGPWVPMIMDSFIILKCGLMSATFTYYIIKKYKRISWFASMFGVFYAMSAYMAAFSWNLMWLDCLVLLPLIMLGLERLVKEKKTVLYTITLAVAVFSNYYIGIMIAIFLILYFLYLVFFDRADKVMFAPNAAEKAKSLVRFAVYSLIAGCMGMASVLPAICALSGTASGDFNFPSSFVVYNNMLELLSKSTILTDTAVFSGYFPNIFCSCAVFILIPLYWINKRINIQRKLGMTVLLIIFLLCFDANIPTYIWHGFHFPNSLPCRQSFIYIALVLVIAYEALIRYRQYNHIQVIVVGALGIAANALFYFMFKDNEFTLLSGAVTAAFIAVYAVLLILLVKKKLNLKLLTIFLLMLCIGESALNTAYTGYSTANYKDYTKDNKTIETLLDSIDYDGFYRVEKVSRRTKNDGTWSDYRSASIFSSETLDGITQFYDDFGMQSSMNAFSYYGHTPLVTTLLGVKYELSKKEVNDSLKELHSMLEYGEDDKMYLYENKNVLGLGFAVDEFEEDMMDLSSSDPFENQNVFAFYTAGVGNLFDIQHELSGIIAEGAFRKTGRGFIYITDKIETAQVKLIRNGIEIVNRNFDDLENPQIIDLGDVEAGDIVSAEAVDEENQGEQINVIPAVMNYRALDDIYEELSENQLELQEFADDHFKGTVKIEEGKMLFTSVAAEDGWEVYVDGKKADYGVFHDAFIFVEMDPGVHELEFIFTPPGQRLGFVISGLAVAIFIVTLIMRKKRR